MSTAVSTFAILEIQFVVALLTGSDLSALRIFLTFY